MSSLINYNILISFLQNNMFLRKRNSHVVNILYTILYDFFFNKNSDDEYKQNYTAVAKVIKLLCRVSNKIYSILVMIYLYQFYRYTTIIQT